MQFVKKTSMNALFQNKSWVKFINIFKAIYVRILFIYIILKQFIRYIIIIILSNRTDSLSDWWDSSLRSAFDMHYWNYYCACFHVSLELFCLPVICFWPSLELFSIAVGCRTSCDMKFSMILPTHERCAIRIELHSYLDLAR